MFSWRLRYLKCVSVVLVSVPTVLSICCSIARDKTSAENLAQTIHSHMQLGDFATVYKESAPRLKAASTESEFVDYFNQIQHGLGSLKEAHEVTYESRLDSRIGRAHALMFELQYERGRLYETMILVRSDRGEMQLWKLGIGSDYPPKNWAVE